MKSSPSPVSERSRPWLRLGALCCLLLVIFALFLPKPGNRTSANAGGSPGTAIAHSGYSTDTVLEKSPPRWRYHAPAAKSAEEIVAGKVKQFGHSRRELVRLIAQRNKTEVPLEVERFFDAVESGNWDEIKAQWDILARRSGQYANSTNHLPELDPFWPSILDAYGVAEQAHLWPAQELLDYGNSILKSLRPGMVYVGGTDNGRWIPELLNETSGDTPHIIVTQNGLADARYLDFVTTLYSDQMTTLTTEDSQAAFQAYISDAQKRLEHDQEFPDEPKQVRTGEDIQMVDGKVQVSGATAVMSINEMLLQILMQKNPDLSFAIQQSFPFKGTYPDALPLGPLMELNASNPQNDFTADRATQSVQYWQATAQQVLDDPEAVDSESVLRSYSHDAVTAANLLAAHNFTSEAEQAYNIALQLWPDNPESVGGLADLYAATGREAEARQLLQDYGLKHPEAQQDMQRIAASWTLVGQAPNPGH